MPHRALYLDTAQDTSRFLRSIADVDRLALDTEGASFHRFVDRIYLLQLSTHERSAIIDPLPIGAPAELGTLLESPEVEIIFHDADYDLRLLHQDYGWQVRNIFDTRVAAQLLGIRAFGLATLLEKYFGVKLDKKHQRADWSMRPLTADMLEYASQDTMHLIGLRNRLAEELESMGRWEWAREEFVRLEETRWEQEDDATAFLRLKGARDLNRRELAVLRELVVWRNDVARRADRATFRVLGNEPLLDIARLKPTTREALASIKGMPRSLLDRASGDLLDAIQRGVTLPDAELPRFPKAVRWERDPEFDLRVTALRTAREAAALRLDMDPGVLCSRDRLEAVARRNPATVEQLREVVELRGWQVNVLGADFLAALRPHRKAAV
ncbi:MAG TPA: HRDC domain-containing protein [Gemmatimonadaceae bacterium]|nr:HRDC domain-containing protein [Gemmatimonadaceae bacterium]